MIFETAVYDGATKVWRLLNLNTGTVYSSHFDSEGIALAAVEHGSIRDGKTVKRIRLRDLREKLD